LQDIELAIVSQELFGKATAELARIMRDNTRLEQPLLTTPQHV
jgi:hypothetical protein